MNRHHTTTPSSLTPSRKTGVGLAMIAAALLTSTAAHAGLAVNAYGFGFARLDVWGAPNQPPADPTHTLSFGGLWPAAILGPNLVNCHPDTFAVTAATGPQPFTYQFNTSGRAVGGDSIGADGAELAAYAVSSSMDAAGDFSFTATVDGPSLRILGNWHGSDSGVVGRIQLFNIDAPNEPYIIYEQLFLNPDGNHDDRIIDLTIPLPAGGIDDLEIRSDMFLSSLPSPSAASLFTLAALATTRSRRR